MNVALVGREASRRPPFPLGMASTNTGQEGLVLSFLFDTDEWVLGNTAGFRNVGSTIDRVKLISAVSGPERAHQLILNWQSTATCPPLANPRTS
jgi:hypothetical protein